jgi:thymidylate synthase
MENKDMQRVIESEKKYDDKVSTARKEYFGEILWLYQFYNIGLVELDEILSLVDDEKKSCWDKFALKNKDGTEQLHPSFDYRYGEVINLKDKLYGVEFPSFKRILDGRKHICGLWKLDDSKKTHNEEPSSFTTCFNTRHGWDGRDFLDMTVFKKIPVKESSFNQEQYIALQKMIAEELGLHPGYFTWKPVNIQLYDRHMNSFDGEVCIDLSDNNISSNDETKTHHS